MQNTVIYIDVLFSLNLIINYFLLFASMHFSKRKINRIRILISSMFGALYSLIIFIPVPNAVLTVSKPLLCMLMVLTAAKFESLTQLLKDSVIFFGINFMFAGLMFGLWTVFDSDFLIFYNGIVYFNIDAKILIISTVIAYIFTEIVFRITDSHIKGEIFEVTITRNGLKLSLKGFLDSGNTLCDPFTSSPVIMASLKKIRPLLSEHELRILETYSAYSLPEHGIKVIPCKTAESHTLLPVFNIDRISFKKDDRLYTSENILLGVSTVFSPPQGYDILLNSKIRLIPLKNEKVFIK